jgi:hypothetical protein
MKPLDLFEYKMQWKPNAYQVIVCSDLDVKCKDWCRKHLERHQWSMDTYTGPYEHTFSFEEDLHAKEFAQEFKEWVR